MPMIRECHAKGCSTLTMGTLCLEHELEAEARDSPVTASKPRVEQRAALATSGRPDPPGSPAIAIHR